MPAGPRRRLHVYFAAPDLNPFRDRPSLILSEVDLAASDMSAAEEQVNVTFVPRDAEEADILQSMSLSDALPRSGFPHIPGNVSDDDVD